MDINDYLIDQDGKDWAALLEPWYWMLPDSFNIWMVNKIGDLILVLEDDQIYFLDIATGKLELIAEGQDDFVTKVNQDDNADHWLGIALVDECEAAGMTLAESQCFGYRLAPVLGGEFTVSNLEPTDLLVHYSIHGQIHEQIQGLPEGETVNIEIVPPAGMTFDSDSDLEGEDQG